MQHDAEPKESHNGQLVVDLVREHGNAPSSWCDRGAFYPVWRAGEFPAARWDTTKISVTRHTLQLPPGFAARMPVGPDVAPAFPAVIGAVLGGAELLRGCDGAA